MNNVHIIIVEWMGYPLFRKKVLGANNVKCGLGRILECMQKHDAGMEYTCSIVVNRNENQSGNIFVRHLEEFWPFNTLSNYSSRWNTEEKYEKLIRGYSFVNQLFFRENSGQDIGAYDFGYKYLNDQQFNGDVLLMNSSVSGPISDGWLLKYHDLFHKEPDTGLCGITMNADAGPHVQSFFLYTSMSVLNHVYPQGLPGGSALVDKGDLIHKGEIAISAGVLDAGYGIRCSAFPDFFYKAGREWAIPPFDVRYKKQYQELANVI